MYTCKYFFAFLAMYAYQSYCLYQLPKELKKDILKHIFINKPNEISKLQLVNKEIKKLSVEAFCNTYKFPLIQAVINKNISLVRLFLESDDMENFILMEDYCGRDALIWAINTNQLPMVKMLIKSNKFDKEKKMKYQFSLFNASGNPETEQPSGTTFGKVHYSYIVEKNSLDKIKEYMKSSAWWADCNLQQTFFQ